MLDRRPEPLGMAFVDVDRAHARQAVDVATGSEDLIATSQQNAANLRVLRQLGEVPGEQCLQLKAQGIGSLGAVQAQ
ncbi:hypothetical protein D3C77_730420 [compost metagenome]